MQTVTLLSRPECHLCDPVRDLLHTQAERLGFCVVEHNVDNDPSLADYSSLIPVVLVDDVKISQWTLSQTQLESALKPKKSPLKRILQQIRGR